MVVLDVQIPVLRGQQVTIHAHTGEPAPLRRPLCLRASALPDCMLLLAHCPLPFPLFTSPQPARAAT